MKRDPLANPTELIRKVYSYAAYRVGAGADAEDVTGEVMVRAVRYRASYDDSKGTPLTWLLGIARTCVNDHLSSRPLVHDDGVDAASPGQLDVETIDRMAVGEAVARLDERDRDLIALRYGADLSTRQISEILGLSRNAIDVALHRTRDRLSVELHREGYEPGRRSAPSLRRVAEPGL